MKINLNNKRIPKNNSFDEKSSSNCSIKKALQTSLGATDNDPNPRATEACEKRRARAMTDCLEGSIEALNQKTHDLIKDTIKHQKERSLRQKFLDR